jgi:hypothetical protein
MGTNGVVDFCSGWYGGGQVAGATTAGLVSYGGIGGAGRLVATKTRWGNQLFGRIRNAKGGPIGSGPPGSPPVKGLLNRGFIRAGMGWKGSTQHGKQIFRVGIGGKEHRIHVHLDFLR